MRSILLAASLIALSASTAFAADDVMANYYGNTVIASGGMVDTHSYYNADHTFTVKAPAVGMEFKGTWKIEGGNLCRTYDSPPPGISNPLCTPAEAHKVGDTWTMSANGKSRTLTLLKGVQ
ncbi:MAG TPA: hypothetical protein VG309_06340 [Rhizomicrobium sp.]|jgi:hypothetical protein|nr:hypothetical protein [Rhizomicrobium sp.]